MNETMEVLPDPERMIEGLRDTGYDFNTAMADIIDNSIAAEATRIDITIGSDFRGNIRIAIADNGYGMNHDGLINAMKYGSDRRPSAASLGKFGLGLKTASTSFCRNLTVISRDDGGQPARQARWDLDHVADEQKWELLLSDSPDEESLDHLEKVAPGEAGTIVVWTKVDRLIPDYQKPNGPHAKKALKRKIDGLVDHAAMVYQRFLDPKDSRAENIGLTINDVAVQAWDPFCKGLSDLAGSEDMTVGTGAGNEAEFSVRAWILPRKEEFPDEDTLKKAKLSNDKQGIYIYRENRLIHSADWLKMFAKEPHGSLLRAEFSFDHRLDEAFHIDIKKSKIILNDDLWNWLKDEFLTAPRREANNRYRKGIRKAAKKKADNSHHSSNNNIKSKEHELDAANVEVLNPDTGECEVNNKQGRFKIKLKVSRALKPGEVFIQPVDGLDDNILFEPGIIDGHKAVRINTAHPYYHKVYVPNLSSGVTIQGMDSLVWALCVAELSTNIDETSEHFKEMRFELSRLLRKLVADLPEPDMENEEPA
ncbi:MAG TPA: ATP-binding protein [Desulfobulbaceae bacterium]|nr:ATP-binding protein [Desulfobulbaceae bacterium]